MSDDREIVLDEDGTPMRKQAHGGSLRVGGNPGNKGGFSLKKQVRQMLREDFRKAAAYLWEIASDPEQAAADRIRAIDLMGKYGIGSVGTNRIEFEPGDLPLAPMIVTVTGVAEAPKVQRQLPESEAADAEEIEVEIGKMRVVEEFEDGSAIIDPPELDLAEPCEAVEEPQTALDDDPPRTPRWFASRSGIRDLSRSAGGSYRGMGIEREC